ncbi:MAG TPA: tyrosine-type recombinase/integrase [Acidimicrobiales bacterium]|jgi:integrase
MARWDDSRGVWRISATASRPGEPRRRAVRDVRAPNTRAGRRVAEAAEVRMRAEMLDQLDIVLPGGTGPSGSFARLAAAWVDRHPDWSPKTLKETRYALRQYILPTLGALPAAKLTPAQVDDLYAEWARAGFAASTRRRWHGMIRAVFSDAYRRSEIAHNPMDRVRAAGGKAAERLHIPEPADVRAAIAAAASPAAAAMFTLAAATGARRGTLVALRWGDLDMDAGTVVFAHAIAVGDNGPVRKGTKANRPYAVHLPEAALRPLREHRARAVETALSVGLAANLGDLYVFSDNGGTRHWSVEYPSHAWRIACARAGVTGCRFHDLRHYAATRMLAAAVPTRTVAERLGCTEANVIRTYSHWVPSAADRQAADVLGDLLEDRSG